MPPILPTRTIRRASVDDVDAISALDDEFATAGQKEFVLSAIQRADAFALTENEKIIGLAILKYTFFECGFISLVCVSPQARRKGAGELLLQYLVSVCKTPKLFSSTNRSNKPMRALFAKAGFEPSGIIHHLDPNDPEIVYYKALKAEATRRDST